MPFLPTVPTSRRHTALTVDELEKIQFNEERDFSKKLKKLTKKRSNINQLSEDSELAWENEVLQSFTYSYANDDVSSLESSLSQSEAMTARYGG